MPIQICSATLEAVKALKLENPSDRRVLEITLRHPEEFTEATRCWFLAMIARDGKRYRKGD